MRPTDSASIAAHYEAQFGRLPDADPDRAFRSQQRMGARSSSWAQLHRLPMRWASGHAGRFDSGAAPFKGRPSVTSAAGWKQFAGELAGWASAPGRGR